MKKFFVMGLLMVIAFLVTQMSAMATGENGVISFVKNKTATVSTADTIKGIMLDEYDWFGMYVSSNDTLQADIFVQYTATGTNQYATYTDSIVVMNPAGGIKFITLRSPKIESIPYGADQMRIIISRRNYTQASVGKYSVGIQAYPYKRYKQKN